MHTEDLYQITSPLETKTSLYAGIYWFVDGTLPIQTLV